ncbi:MAG: glycosyltransferase, partial [Nitratireductor sp.]
KKGLVGGAHTRFIALESDIAYHQLIAGAEPSGLCMDPFDKFKVLMYSHDTFGLGHLRRSRTIAHALVSHFRNVEVSIISGSPVVSAYPFEDRVDYVQIPAAHKLTDGTYVSGSASSTFDDTIRQREALIDEAADRIDPQLVIVDKEPLGLAREMLPALQRLKQRGATTVLGLRDVLDAPELLREEWARKHILDHLEALYDEIWIYGPGSFYNPLAGIDLPEAVLARTRYTGFLPRALPETGEAPNDYGSGYVLVTAGGGGDGYELMAAALNVIRQGLCDHLAFLFVLGPFMTDKQRFEIMARASGLAHVRVVDFDANLEAIVANARAVIGMCGYNTFCEVMSFDRPALFIPRTAPRREQSIRAHRAEEFGWVDVLDIESAKNPHRFLAAIDRLLERAPPSAAVARPDMDGLNRICALSEILLDRRREAATATASLRAASL